MRLLAGAMRDRQRVDAIDAANYGGRGVWIWAAAFGACFILVIVFAIAAPSRTLSGIALLIMGSATTCGGIAGIVALFRDGGNLGWVGHFLARRGAAILLGLGMAMVMFGLAMITKR